MTENSVHLQPAFIIQHRSYRETSLILDVLTRDYGRISLIAKGVRKAKSKTAGLLQPFIPLLLSFTGKAELKTVTAVEIAQPFNPLQGFAIYCGFYINELIYIFLHKHDPHPEVFHHYQHCLTDLGESSTIESALRLFELQLMESIGYGLQLLPDAYEQLPFKASKKYMYTIEAGLIESEEGLFSGTTLLAIKAQNFADPQVLAQTKQLMRIVIDSHLQGKPLKSRAMINKLVKHLK